MDTLYVKDLVIMAKHGVFEEEKSLGQKFLLSVKAKYNMKKAATSNNLDASINYGDLSINISKLLTENTYDLIETCAYEVLKYIFGEYDFVVEVEVSIKKPWAPIGLPLDYPEVTISRKKRRYYIGIGTNQGNREENIDKASDKMKDYGFKIINSSKIYETPAWGLEDQPDFLNQAVEIESYENPEDLLKILNEIEDDLGRVRSQKWGPRIIDLDILFAGSQIIYTDDLKIPHPYIEEREFVLEPLNEIAPFFVHPVLNKQIRILYDDLRSKK